MLRIQLHKNIEKIIWFLHRVGVWNRGDVETVAERRLKIFYSIYMSLIPMSFLTGALASENVDEIIFSIQITLMTTVYSFSSLDFHWT